MAKTYKSTTKFSHYIKFYNKGEIWTLLHESVIWIHQITCLGGEIYITFYVKENLTTYP